MGGGGGCPSLDCNNDNNLKKLFDYIPTVDEVRSNLSGETQIVIENFVKKVKGKMEETNELHLKVCIYSSEEYLFEGIYADQIEAILNKKGWDIIFYKDTQKGGSHIELAPKENEK